MYYPQPLPCAETHSTLACNGKQSPKKVLRDRNEGYHPVAFGISKAHGGPLGVTHSLCTSASSPSCWAFLSRWCIIPMIWEASWAYTSSVNHRRHTPIWPAKIYLIRRLEGKQELRYWPRPNDSSSVAAHEPMHRWHHVYGPIPLHS